MLRLSKIMLGEMQRFRLEILNQLNLDIPHLPLFKYKCAKEKPWKKIIQSESNF